MIARIQSSRQTPTWQRQLAEAIRDPGELIELLELDPQLLPAAQAAARQFELRVPRPFVARMSPGDPHDPLLRQVLPLGDELAPAPGFGPDPVGDLDAMAAPGVLHKYHGRVLAIASGACAVHCRYCFRRAFPYHDAQLTGSRRQALLDHLRRQPEVEEAILSGGDPLSLSDPRLGELVRELETIAHLKRLRVHTRLPVVLPDRITDELASLFGHSRLQCVMVLHCNHAHELSPALALGLQRLRAAGVTLLNQSVLLRGVNDRAQTLARLSTALFEHGVLPYYLHMLDPVQGAAHFDVGEKQAVALMGQLAATLPGYLVPRLVREIPGAPAKTPIDAS